MTIPSMPNLPSDSIWKFLTFLGLFTILATSVGFFWTIDDYADRVTTAAKATDEAQVAQDDYEHRRDLRESRMEGLLAEAASARRLDTPEADQRFESRADEIEKLLDEGAKDRSSLNAAIQNAGTMIDDVKIRSYETRAFSLLLVTFMVGLPLFTIGLWKWAKQQAADGNARVVADS